VKTRLNFLIFFTLILAHLQLTGLH